MTHFSRHQAVVVFLAFALAYFFSALIRAITATLSPTLSAEFNLQASELGLLAGGYFLGFAAMQLPLGAWLDRFGPKRVIVVFLCMAIAGCLAFSWASSFSGLLVARVMCGIGVSACLMAPLTGYRRWLTPTNQLRANSWMLMTGSLGMVASTLPVQWLLPVYGWRPLFIGLAGMVFVSIAVIAWQVPVWDSKIDQEKAPETKNRYADIWRHPYFKKMTPIGFFAYGGLLAIQTLWAVPWMIKVAGFSPLQAATGLFWINVAMLGTFWMWGWINPTLALRGINADRLMTLGMPLSFLMLGILITAGPDLGSHTGWVWMVYCMSSSFISLAQPAVGMAFSPEMAGRALSAYNLVIFSGVFVTQWGIGLLIDALKQLGLREDFAFRMALGLFLFCCVVSYLYFLLSKSHNQDNKSP